MLLPTAKGSLTAEGVEVPEQVEFLRSVGCLGVRGDDLPSNNYAQVNAPDPTATKGVPHAYRSTVRP